MRVGGSSRSREPPLKRAALLLAALLGGVTSPACNNLRDELSRAQRAFDRNQHDRALSLLRDLEPDATRLTRPEQAEYAYLRGMTDYRIGYRTDARHWLALASAYEEASPGILPTDWKTRLAAALEELDGVVVARGYAALAAPPDTGRRPRRKGGSEKPR